MTTDFREMLIRIWNGALLMGLTYFLTYGATAQLMGRGQGLAWSMTRPMALLLTVIPYLAGGIYCRCTRKAMPKLYPLWTGLFAASFERLFIIGVGYFFFARGGDGSMEGISLIGFIRGEAAPYFTWPYITIGGLCSVAITWIVSLGRIRPGR